MNTDDHRDQLIDMLLRELVGGEAPPDLRQRIMTAAARLPVKPVARSPRPPTRRVMHTRSMSPLLALAAVLALLASGVSFLHFREVAAERTPVLTSTSGTVNRDMGALREGESLTTGAASEALLTYPDGTTVELGADTTLRVAASRFYDRSKALELVVGGIRASVRAQPAGQPMILDAGEARAQVVGTQLSLQRSDERTRLEVQEGAVHFIPKSGDTALMVKTGLFAEAGKSGVQSGAIVTTPRRGIVRFTLMNADTDAPLRTAPLVDGEALSLASLPTRNINLRADYEGEAPTSVRMIVTRHDGQSADLPTFAAKDQTQPPFFAAGDYWAEGRPDDCRAWTPPLGHYHISATAVYAETRTESDGEPLVLDFRITE